MCDARMVHVDFVLWRGWHWRGFTVRRSTASVR